MLKQSERESRIENRCIQKLNKALAGVELTRSEEKTLLWLAGWEEHCR